MTLKINWDAVGLGERRDTDIAADLGCSPATVGNQRRKRGIPYHGSILSPHRPKPPPDRCATCGGTGHDAIVCPTPPWESDPNYPWVVIANMDPAKGDEVFFLNSYHGFRSYPKDFIDSRCFWGMNRMPHYFPRLGVAMKWMQEHPGEIVQLDVRAFHERTTGLSPAMIDWDRNRMFPRDFRVNELNDWTPPEEEGRLESEPASSESSNA